MRRRWVLLCFRIAVKKILGINLLVGTSRWASWGSTHWGSTAITAPTSTSTTPHPTTAPIPRHPSSPLHDHSETAKMHTSQKPSPLTTGVPTCHGDPGLHDRHHVVDSHDHDHDHDLGNYCALVDRNEMMSGPTPHILCVSHHTSQ
jgi:hypothetical protein